MNTGVDGEFEIIWLDQQRSQNVLEHDHLQRRVDLGQLFTYLHIANSVENCFDYLSRLHTDEKVLLIVNGSLGESIIPLVHEIAQLVSIFVFCGDTIKHREWACQYSKIHGIFNKAEELVEAVRRDVGLLAHHFIPANIFTIQDIRQNSFQNINKEQANFMWFQLLIDVLTRLPQSEQGKQDLIDECQRCYAKDQVELKKITEFEMTYTSDQAIRWYTRDSFLFRLLNRAFRTRNIDSIFRFRYFFSDLYQQLSDLYRTQQDLSSIQTVYRGQIISVDELSKLKENIGGIYSVNTFLSTSISSTVALSFNAGALVRPYIERVLFQIQINHETNGQQRIPFANIRAVSYKQDENEVLLGMGSVFRIDSVTFWSDDFWLVELTLLERSGIDESLREYFLTRNVGTRSTLLDLSHFLDRMGEPLRAKRFCELLLQQDLISNDLKIQTYIDLGYYQYKLGEFLAAESSCQLSLQIQQAFNCLAPATYGLLGLIETARQKYHLACQYHQLSVDLIRENRMEENETVANLYADLGMAWLDFDLPVRALYWCEQMALPLQLKLLPANHPDLLTTYANIAEIYNRTGKYAEAHVYYKRTFQIQRNILPSSHIDLASTLQGLSLVCQRLGKYNDALIYLRKEQKNILYSSAYDKTDLVPNYLGFASVYEQLEKDNRALIYYKKVLAILSVKNLQHRTQLATAWNNIGFLYLQKKRYKAAMIYFCKALQLEKKFLPVRAPLVLTTLSNIGMVYQEFGLLRKALFYHQFVLNKRQQYLRSCDPDLAITWDNIGVVLCKNGQYKKAIEHHRRALTNYVLTLPLDHPATVCICEHLGDVYRLLGKKDKSKQYYNKPEQMARAHWRKIEKSRNEGDESDELIICKEDKLALLIDPNAFAYSTEEQRKLQLDGVE